MTNLTLYTHLPVGGLLRNSPETVTVEPEQTNGSSMVKLGFVAPLGMLKSTHAVMDADAPGHGKLSVPFLDVGIGAVVVVVLEAGGFFEVVVDAVDETGGASDDGGGGTTEVVEDVLVDDVEEPDGALVVVEVELVEDAGTMLLGGGSVGSTVGSTRADPVPPSTATSPPPRSEAAQTLPAVKVATMMPPISTSLMPGRRGGESPLSPAVTPTVDVAVDVGRSVSVSISSVNPVVVGSPSATTT